MPTDRLSTAVARLETKTEVEMGFVKETLLRIESKLDAVIAAQDETDTRVTKVESDISWFKKIGAPAIAIFVNLVGDWAKHFVGM
jgi:hypothetical protein